MRHYPAALLAIAVIAEFLGLGGTPAKAVAFENALFVVLFLTLIATAFRRFLAR